MSLEEQIQIRINEIAADSEARFATPSGADFHKIAVTQNALPIYCDVSGYIAIRPDKSLVFWGGEGTDLENEVEPVFQTIALISGSKRYPELSELIPKRTSDALACADCKGGGKAIVFGEQSEVMICGKCLGLGWINQEIASLSESLRGATYERQEDA